MLLNLTFEELVEFKVAQLDPLVSDWFSKYSAILFLFWESWAGSSVEPKLPFDFDKLII